jgi:hypothetical protein
VGHRGHHAAASGTALFGNGGLYWLEADEQMTSCIFTGSHLVIDA